MKYDTIIIGAGPAGIAAAIYLKRAGRNICMLERKHVGGLLHNAHHVENYPGFHGVRGKELAGHMKGQLHKWDIDVVHETATAILEKDSGFRIVTPDNERFARTVVLATGTIPKKLDIEGAQEMEGVHLFYEVVDLPEQVSGKDMVVIGSGDAAFDYALNLSEQEASVIITFRGGNPKCLPLLLERVKAQPSVHIYPDFHPVSFRSHNDRIIMKCHHIDIEADYVLGAIGRVPEDHLLSDFKEMPAGLFVAGDIQQGKCRQVGIAVGDGISSAMQILDYLEASD